MSRARRCCSTCLAGEYDVLVRCPKVTIVQGECAIAREPSDTLPECRPHAQFSLNYADCSFTVLRPLSSASLRLFSFVAGGKLSFADFLDVMHTHSKKEKVPQEILEAFYGSDRTRSGQIALRDLKHILCGWGERLDPKTVDQLFREANITGPYVKYHEFVRIICAPVPDY